ncbi:Pseudouridine-5'-phosphate glycosidase [Frankliniella fusca]|uniref:Pseudouridine-5'-phosphate glycosidase n=1 Tax=Frankliniella fusca TaxID=407009 RepID=A0AAE1LFQ9_9NEOP|nr:Pseudouridine-5'-phosphate glycosidase [Frankliniella fusca]
MVMDGNGSGRVAGYAIVINELATTVTAVLKSFRDAVSNEVADKIKTEKSKKESEEVRSIIDKMKYADPVTFDGLLKNLEAEASPEFYKYFYDKWAICPHAWSFKDKQQSINLGNSTTNRVECHNSKIKMLLSYNTSLPEAVDSIIYLAQNKEDDVFFRDTSESLKKAYLTTSDDPLSAEILKDLTKFCARLLLWELEVDTTKEEVTSYEASTTECKCVFSCSYDLPCRHKFYCRREAGEELYKRDENDKMWWKTGPRQNTLIKHPGDAKQIVMPTKSAPKHHNEKYSAAMQTCKQICNVLAESGQPAFLRRLDDLRIIFKLWARNKEIKIEEISEAGPLSTGKEMTVKYINTHAEADQSLKDGCEEGATNAENYSNENEIIIEISEDVAEALNAGNADQSSNDKCVEGARSAENYSNENEIIETSEDLEEEMNSGNESDQSSSDELVEGAINAGNGSYGDELIMENKPEDNTNFSSSKSLNDNSGIIDETDHDRTIEARTEGSLLVRLICDSYQLCPSRSTSPLLIEKQLSPCAQNSGLSHLLESNDENSELLGLAEMIASIEEHVKNTVEVSTPPQNNKSSFAIFKTPENRNSQSPSLDENCNSTAEVSTPKNDNHATGFKTPIKDVEGPNCKCIPPKPSVRKRQLKLDAPALEGHNVSDHVPARETTCGAVRIAIVHRKNV